MFGSAILETALGLLLVYFVLSTISSSLSEGISRLLSWRAKNLKSAIGNMLGGDNLLEELYKTDLIRSLSKNGNPSYIKSKDFARALISLVAEKDGQKGPVTANRVQSALNTRSVEFAAIRRGLLNLVTESGMDLGNLTAGVEEWFDSVMERASGWYKRMVASAIVVVASLLVIVSNADTIMMLNVLYSSANTRSTIVALADEVPGTAANPDSETGDQEFARAAYDVMNQNLIGWGPFENEAPRPGLAGYVHRTPPSYTCGAEDAAAGCMQGFLLGWLVKLIGLALTVAAVSMGAPFWFDLLNRFTNLRAAGARIVSRMETAAK